MVLTYTARFGRATEEDSCNLMQLDPSVLNVPAATRFSPTLSNVDIFNLATGELPSVLAFPFTSVRTAGDPQGATLVCFPGVKRVIDNQSVF